MSANTVAKGRKFVAYILSQILTTGVVIVLIVAVGNQNPEALTTLGQFFIGFQTVLTGGYIGFNVLQKKVANEKPQG